MKLDIVPQQLYSKLQKRLHPDSEPTGSTAYEYRDESGNIIGCVARIDYLKDGQQSKTFIQSDYSKQYKKFKTIADQVKTSLYNRDKIVNADTVVWVEGEKAACALQEIVPSNWAVTTNAGGASNAKNVNLSPLSGKRVIIWHDNDSVGKHGAIKLSTKLLSQKIKVAGWVDVKEDEWEQKDDAFDIIKKYGNDYVIDLLNDLQKPQESSVDIPEILPKDEKPFLVLGRSVEDDIVVYCYQDATIRSFSSNSFDEGMMVKIYNDIAFWNEYCGMNPRSNKPDKVRGWQRLWGEVLKCGIFEPAITRYGGIYKEDTQYVANLGDHLYVNGDIKDLADYTDNGIYVEDRKSKVDTEADELTENECKTIIEYFENLQCRKIEQRQLILGWVIASILAPILPKRPHLWLYAPANTGKSFIAGRMKKLIEPFTISLDSSSTTFAGLKQYVQGRGCAVFWDESEAQSQGQQSKWDRVMEVVKVSFDARDGKIVQGSREQVAQFFVPRMMFCFSSVKMADFEETLSTRIIPIDLNRQGSKQDMINYFKRSRQIENKIDWETVPSKLFKTVYKNADVFFNNFETAQEIFVSRGVDDRRANALAVCYAGFLMLRARKTISMDVMDKMIWSNPYKLMPEQQSDVDLLRSLILSSTINVNDANNMRKSVMFRDYVNAVQNDKYFVNDVAIELVSHEFKLHGLQYTYKRDKGTSKVFVWEKSPRLSRVMGRYDGITSVAPNLNGYKRHTTNQGLSGFVFDL